MSNPKFRTQTHAGLRRGGSQRRGSTLIASVILIFIAAASILFWLTYVIASSQAGVKDRARTTALYAAEAGIERVVDYFNFPANYTGEFPENYTTQAVQPATYPLAHPVAPATYHIFDPYIVTYQINPDGKPAYDATGQLVVTRFSYFQNIGAGTNPLVSKTSKVPTFDIDVSNDERLIFRDANNREIARVVQLRLMHPTDIEIDEGSLPLNLRLITKVVSTARTPDGTEVTVEVSLTENPTFRLASPAAVITRGTLTWNGDVGVRWGEAWAKLDIDVPVSQLKTKYPVLDKNAAKPYYSASGNTIFDSWFLLRTEGLIKSGTSFYDGRVDGLLAAAATPSATNPINKIPLHEDYLHSRNKRGNLGSGNNFQGFENLRQRQTLEFPDYDYDAWKYFIQENNYKYFFTDTNGNIFGEDRNPSSSTYGQIVQKTYNEWFNTTPTDPKYNDLHEWVVFIDTVPTNAAGEPAPKDGRGIPIINSEYYPRNPKSGGLMPTIQVSGSGLHTRGAFFIAADVKMTGQGSPPSAEEINAAAATVDDPEQRMERSVLMPPQPTSDGTNWATTQIPPRPDRMKIFHNGFLYGYGQIDFGGNRTIYGSVYAEGGYGGGGTPDIYYNYRMKNGQWLNLSASRVNRRLWNVRETPLQVASAE